MRFGGVCAGEALPVIPSVGETLLFLVCSDLFVVVAFSFGG
jgi:hypothetical protein